MDKLIEILGVILPICFIIIVFYLLYKDESKNIVKYDEIKLPTKNKRYLRCIYISGYDFPTQSSMILINNRNLELHIVIENNKDVTCDVIEIKDIVKVYVNDENYNYVKKTKNKKNTVKAVKCYNTLLVLKNNKQLNFICFKDPGKYL